MLTTTVDGLWVLQVLTGIETLAPELGLRPHLPSVEPKRLALAHAITAELRAAGVIDTANAVDSTVIEWLTVLSRRDIALFIQIRLPGTDEPARVLLARFAQWWVVMERSEDLVRISGAGTAGAAEAANTVLSAQIDRLCGENGSARLRPVTLDADALGAAADSVASLRDFLAAQRLDIDQLHTLSAAADPSRSAQASMVAIQSGVATGQSRRTYVEQSTVTLIDTPAGRLIVENIYAGDKKWAIIAPGTKGNTVTAVNNMLCRLPAGEDWYSYRKII